MYTSAVPRGTATLILISVVVFLVDLLTGHQVLLWGAKSPAIWAGEWYRLVTPNFIHSGVAHLLFDMYALFIFGRIVEGVAGTLRFLAVFFIGGLIGFYASLLASPGGLSVGASAAIFALMGYTLHYRLRRLPLRWLSIDSAFAQILGLNLIVGLSIPNIDQFAHGGGLLGGALAGSLAGFPHSERRPGTGSLERIAAVAVLLLLTWGSLTPLSFADGAAGVAPRFSQSVRERYGKYFVSFIASDSRLFWVDPSQEEGDWKLVEEHIARPRETPMALGIFWRWIRGGGAGEAADYSVRWRRRHGSSGSWVTVHADRGRVMEIDPDGERIYRRSLVVRPRVEALAGQWHILVEVDGTTQFEREFTVSAR